MRNAKENYGVWHRNTEEPCHTTYYIAIAYLRRLLILYTQRGCVVAASYWFTQIVAVVRWATSLWIVSTAHTRIINHVYKYI